MEQGARFNVERIERIEGIERIERIEGIEGIEYREDREDREDKGYIGYIVHTCGQQRSALYLELHSNCTLTPLLTASQTYAMNGAVKDEKPILSRKSLFALWRTPSTACSMSSSPRCVGG
jgi:hypothetical protein